MSGELDALTLRPFRASDEAYVMATWMNSARQFAGVRGERKFDFFKAIRPLVEEHVKSSDVRVLCLRDEDNALFGFVCSRQGELVYAYVAHELRGKGLGQKLIAEAAACHPIRSAA